MSTLAELVTKLILDASGFASGLTTAENAAGASTQKISSSLKSIGQDVTMAGVAASAAITAPVMLFADASVKAAETSELAGRRVQAVFGDSAASITTFASTAAEKLGMSDSAALQAASTFGNMFTMMGIQQGTAADMSTSLVSLSADLASFNGMDPTDVLQKLQSGMMGATRGLKEMGIVISEADIKQEALSLKLWDGKGALDDQTKAMATFQLIMDKTSKMSGDFSKNQDSLANSTKVATAEFDQIKEEFGKDLMPIAIKLMDALIPILKWLENLPAPVKSGILVFMGLAAAVGPVLIVIGQLITFVGTLVGLFGTGGALAGAFAGLVPALAAIGAAFGAVILPILAIAAAIALPAIAIYLMYTNFMKFLPMYEGLWNSVVTWIQGVIKQITDVDWGQIGKDILNGIWNGLKSGWDWLKNQVAQLAQDLLNAAKWVLGISSPSSVFAEVGKNISLGMGEGITQYSNVPMGATANMAMATIPAAVSGSSGGGSGRVVNVIVNLTPAPFSFADERTIAQQLSPVLQVELRRLGVI